MRKRPVSGDLIPVLKDAAALIAEEIASEQEALARWEHNEALSIVYKLRCSKLLDKAVTSRHKEEIRLRERVLKKLKSGLRCGAKTRRGTPCQAMPLPGRTRCRLHGGKSTGPVTEAGRQAIRESNRRRSIDASLRRATREDASQPEL